MSDFERDFTVTNLLTVAGDEATRFVQPDGVGAVVSTVRRRRRTRMMAATVLALVVLGTPAAALALARVPHTAPPGGGPSASVSPSGSPRPRPSASSTPAAPDGRIGTDELRGAVIDIPAWPNGFDDGCPTGRVHFADGKAGQVMALQGSPVYIDVDHDGALETVVLISCSPQGTDYKVLALDRDTNGAVVTLGQVVGSAGNMGHAGVDIMTIWGVEAGDNGQVRVDVGEYRPCCEQAQASQHQWRVYGWNGTAFTQTGGPTAFGENPKVTNLVVTPAPLSLTRQQDGSYQGTLHLTIHNATRYPTPGQLALSIDVDGSWAVQPAAGSGCQLNIDQPRTCRLPVLAAGADRKLDLAITVPPGGPRAQCVVYVDAVDATGLVYPSRATAPTTVVAVTWS